MLTSGFGVFSVCMKIVRRPAGQAGCAHKSDDTDGLLMGLECAVTLHGVNAADLAVVWIGLRLIAATFDKCFDLNSRFAWFSTR